MESRVYFTTGLLLYNAQLVPIWKSEEALDRFVTWTLVNHMVAKKYITLVQVRLLGSCVLLPRSPRQVELYLCCYSLFLTTQPNAP